MEMISARAKPGAEILPERVPAAGGTQASSEPRPHGSTSGVIARHTHVHPQDREPAQVGGPRRGRRRLCGAERARAHRAPRRRGVALAHAASIAVRCSRRPARHGAHARPPSRVRSPSSSPLLSSPRAALAATARASCARWQRPPPPRAASASGRARPRRRSARPGPAERATPASSHGGGRRRRRRGRNGAKPPLAARPLPGADTAARARASGTARPRPPRASARPRATRSAGAAARARAGRATRPSDAPRRPQAARRGGGRAAETRARAAAARRSRTPRPRPRALEDALARRDREARARELVGQPGAAAARDGAGRPRTRRGGAFDEPPRPRAPRRRPLARGPGRRRRRPEAGGRRRRRAAGRRRRRRRRRAARRGGASSATTPSRAKRDADGAPAAVPRRLRRDRPDGLRDPPCRHRGAPARGVEGRDDGRRRRRRGRRAARWATRRRRRRAPPPAARRVPRRRRRRGRAFAGGAERARAGGRRRAGAEQFERGIAKIQAPTRCCGARAEGARAVLEPLPADESGRPGRRLLRAARRPRDRPRAQCARRAPRELARPDFFAPRRKAAAGARRRPPGADGAPSELGADDDAPDDDGARAARSRPRAAPTAAGRGAAGAGAPRAETF